MFSKLVTLCALVCTATALNANNIVQQLQARKNDAATPEFVKLVNAIERNWRIVNKFSVDELTVFAPTDAAFAKLPSGFMDNLLLPANLDDLAAFVNYHAVSGKLLANQLTTGDQATLVSSAVVKIDTSSGVVKVNDATVTMANVECSNGVIHEINTVLTRIPKTVVDIVNDGTFPTLANALDKADLNNMLSNANDPFTVFAPTEAAFDRLEGLEAGFMDNLLLPENKDDLVAFLKYHVLPGKVLAADLTGSFSTPSIQGSYFAIDVSGDPVRVNDAMVTPADDMASNGVVHTISEVLKIPPTESPSASPTSTPTALLTLAATVLVLVLSR